MQETREKTIGFCGAVWQEVVNQRLTGVIRYVDDHASELALRDFRFRTQYGDIEHRPPPPWTGIADGVIVCFGIAGDAEAIGHWLERGGVPVVSMVNDWKHPGIPIVDTDSRAAGTMAADYFVDQKHKHFAFIGGDFSAKSTPVRHERFAARLAEHGFTPLACGFTFFPEGNTDDLQHLVKETDMIAFLNHAPKPLAAFALNDNHARALALLCEHMKLRVPDDVAILGSGNFTTSRCHTPTISTVLTPSDQIGYEAARLLHRLMDGERSPAQTNLLRPLRVIERQSTTAKSPGDDIATAVKYIRDYACDGIHVDEVVRMISTSRRALELQFAERFDETPKQMIQRVRLERAKQLLGNTQLSITQVAMMTGFTDVAAFANFMRKHTGTTPTAWRENRDGCS